MTTTVTTPWGKAAVTCQVAVPQRAGDKRFSAVVQLLETTDGERLVRVAYGLGGAARRGPVTLRRRDVEKLREALLRAPELAGALRGEER